MFYVVISNFLSFTDQEKACHRDWKYFQGFCYFYDEKLLNWNAARSACYSRGAYLVDIQSAAENDFISGHAKTSLTWLGYNDILKEGSFIWNRTGVDGSFTKWHQGSPDNTWNNGADCAAISTGTWHDRSCTHLHASFCKKGMLVRKRLCTVNTNNRF